MIYLDNAATTRISPEVLQEMMPYLEGEYGNAGSLHTLGRNAAEAVQKARSRVAELIGAKPEQIIFTSGGSEANNLAVSGIAYYLKSIGKPQIVTSLTEHESMLKAINDLCIKQGFGRLMLKVDKSGRVSVGDLQDVIESNKSVGLVSVMGVNNEIGTPNPIDKIGEICRKNDILFMTDCVQAAGTTELDVDKIGCDLMSLSSHKLHGPKGAGALYVRDKRILTPIIHGGNMQEAGKRGGTENVAAIVGFGKACEVTLKEFSRRKREVSIYKKSFYDILRREMSKCGLEMRVNGLAPEQGGKILSITFPGVDAETLVLLMDSKGVYISAGSACMSHESHPSHVLKAIGLSDEDARNTVRISFSKFNSFPAVWNAALLLAECVKSLKGVKV